jgi:hypothetical protein
MIMEDLYRGFGWLVRCAFICGLDGAVLFLFSSGTVIIQLLWTRSEITERNSWQEE